MDTARHRLGRANVCWKRQGGVNHEKSWSLQSGQTVPNLPVVSRSRIAVGSPPRSHGYPNEVSKSIWRQRVHLTSRFNVTDDSIQKGVRITLPQRLTPPRRPKPRLALHGNLLGHLLDLTFCFPCEVVHPPYDQSISEQEKTPASTETQATATPLFDSRYSRMEELQTNDITHSLSTPQRIYHLLARSRPRMLATYTTEARQRHLW